MPISNTELTLLLDHGQPSGLTAKIRRYATGLRRQLWMLSSHSDRFADLLESFPCACVMIVSRPDDDPTRARALDLVERGAPRSDIAEILDIPKWLRKLPPEAFVGQLPTTGVLGSSAFGARVLNLMPQASSAQGPWLNAVVLARTLLDDNFAVWIGGQRVLRTRSAPSLPLQSIALFAWYSQHPELAPARLIQSRWTPRMGLARAAGETRRWLLSVLHLHCGYGPGGAVEGVAQHAEGYDFVPLDTPDAILEEARAMRNCLAQYIEFVVCGQSRLYSIRLDGQRVATMEVRASIDASEPTVHQVRKAWNAAPPDDVMAATAAWLDASKWGLIREFTSVKGRRGDDTFNALVWHPYVQAVIRENGAAAALRRPTVATLMGDMRYLWALQK